MNEINTNNEIIKYLKETFPHFEINPEYIDLPYLIASDFARYLIHCYSISNFDELKIGFDFIEILHKSKKQDIKELATIGYLESLQNNLINSNINPEFLDKYLGNESRKWWEQLNNFWNKEIKHVDETLK